MKWQFIFIIGVFVGWMGRRFMELIIEKYGKEWMKW